MEITEPTTDCAAPTQPAELFQWLCAQDLPLLEDETPPPGFFEVDETEKIAYHCDRCTKRRVAQLLQRSIGIQTIAKERGQPAADAEAETQTVWQSSHNHLLFRCIDGQTQTSQEDGNLQNLKGVTAHEVERITVLQAKEDEETSDETSQVAAEHARTQAQSETQTTTTLPLLSSRLPVAIPNSSEALSLPQPLLVVVQDVLTLRLRCRSIWSLIKALLVIISLLHSCYVIGGILYRLPLLRRLLMRAQSICAPQTPQTPQAPQTPTSRSLSSFIWGQLCRLAHNLNIV